MALSIIKHDIFRAAVFFPIALFILIVAIRLHAPLISKAKNRSLRFCGDMIEFAFYFWAILATENDLLFIFVVNHLIIGAIEEAVPYDSLKQVAVLSGIAFCAVLRKIKFNDEWESVISSAVLQALCTAAAIMIGKLIRKAHAGEASRLQEAEKKVSAQNTILSTLSHELRTPLTMIKLSGEILLGERPGRANDLQKTFLKTIVRNTIRLIKITESILARIKVETTWLKLRPIPLDIRSVVGDVVTQMRPILQQEEKSIGFFHPKLISTVMADGNWIAQVVINLLHNAKKNVGPNGKILVTVKENEQFVVVSVSDDGEGIRDNSKEHVYNEFYSESVKAAGAVEGVGMGLAIAKYVVERHGGKIYLGSITGLGTTFSFALKKGNRSI